MQKSGDCEFYVNKRSCKLFEKSVCPSDEFLEFAVSLTNFFSNGFA
jgi:hypothetical protein